MPRFKSYFVPGIMLAVLLGACAATPAPIGAAEIAASPVAAPAADVHAATVMQAQGSVQNRLPCYRGTPLPACDLRIYQIMVESFVDADPLANYRYAYGTSHHRGDLQGVIRSLDYIKSLGVNAIWLTPIFKSVRKTDQDYWTDLLDGTGYYASDYFQIDPKFGSFRQAKTLVDEAHKRGLYVFFDGVFGHHKNNIVASPSGLRPAGKAKWVDYPESLAFFKEVATYWIEELKIDGWRLDQAYQVPAEQWAVLRAAVEDVSRRVTYQNADGKEVHPLGYMVGEIWKSPGMIARLGYGTNEKPALLSAFDFPMRYRLVQTLAVEEAFAESGLGSMSASNLSAGFDSHAEYPDHAIPNLMLSNHDLLRFGDLLQRGGLADVDQDGYWQRHKAAFAFMAAYSGPITLYYGDEIGQEVRLFADKVDKRYCASQGLCDDHVSRISAVIEGLSPAVGEAPSVLTPRQRDLKDYVARLMALRQQHPALARGSRTPILADEQVYIDLKIAGTDRVLFLLNTRSTRAEVNVHASVLGEHAVLADLSDSTTLKPEEGFYRFSLPPFAARFVAVR